MPIHANVDLLKENTYLYEGKSYLYWIIERRLYWVCLERVMSWAGFCWPWCEKKKWHFKIGLHWWEAQSLTSSCPSCLLPHTAVKHCIGAIYSYIANTVCFAQPANLRRVEGLLTLKKPAGEKVSTLCPHQKFTSGLFLLLCPKE